MSTNRGNKDSTKPQQFPTRPHNKPEKKQGHGGGNSNPPKDDKDK